MKNTNYCIIDHIGSLESTDIMKACYKKAFDISEKKATYTMKGFCQKISRNPNTKVSDKQKNFVRFNKHPEEVILICNEFNTNAHWIADVWAEKTDKLTVIEASTNEVYTLEDLHPEWFATYQIDINEYSNPRRCANIWGNALGWSFSAPLYRDDKLNATENYVRNKQACQNVPETHQSKLSKIATRPESYLKTKAIASDKECKDFFEYYKYLYTTDSLETALEPGYQLCPDCGRPINIDKAELELKSIPKTRFKHTTHYTPRQEDRVCMHCDLVVPAEMLNNFTPYFDDSYNDEDWDQFPFLSFNQEVIMKILQTNQNLHLVLDKGKYKIITDKTVIFETTSIDLAYELFQKGA